MKIGIDVRTLADKSPSGVSEYTRNLLGALIREGRSDEYSLFYNGWKKVDLSGFAPARIVRTGYPNKLFNYLLVPILKYPKIDRLLGCDLFFAPHLNFTALSGRAGSVLTIHDLSFLRHPEFFSRKKNYWHRLINVKNLAGRFDRLIALSENTKRDLMDLLGVEEEKIRVINSGIDPELRPLDHADPRLAETAGKYRLPQKFILTLSTIEPRKNLVNLIESFDRLIAARPEFSDCGLVIVGGTGWLAGKIFRARLKARSRDKIRFLGYVPREEKIALYNLASIFVFPSYYEGFGFPPLEAMACGTPVIASAATSLPEVVGGAGLLVDPDNQADLIGALGAVFSDGRLREWLRQAGFEQVKKFSWAVAAKKYREAFGELIERA